MRLSKWKISLLEKMDHDTLVEEHNREVNEILAQMAELNTIFDHMNGIVKSQELEEKILPAVESAEQKVEEGVKEIEVVYKKRRCILL